MREKLAVLRAGESRRWDFYFCYFVSCGRSGSSAASSAWRCLCRDFPRLAAFAGCRP